MLATVDMVHLLFRTNLSHINVLNNNNNSDVVQLLEYIAETILLQYCLYTTKYVHLTISSFPSLFH